MSSTRADRAGSAPRLATLSVLVLAVSFTGVLLSGPASTGAVMTSQGTASATVTATPACASGSAAYATYLAAMAPAPTFWWRFDTAPAGTTVKDYAPGNLNSGTVRSVGASPSGLTFGTPGSGLIHCDTTFAVQAAGGAGSKGFVVLNTSRLSPTSFTITLWAKVPVGASGRLFGFGNKNTTASTTQDRAVGVDATGHATFTLRTAPASVLTLTSPSPISDGKAHLLVATFGTGTATLYVDGAPVATRTGVALRPSYTGYWRAGYDQPGQCAGSLDEIAVWEGTVLSASKITALAGADHWW
jgi:hypothetical protein